MKDFSASFFLSIINIFILLAGKKETKKVTYFYALIFVQNYK